MLAEARDAHLAAQRAVVNQRLKAERKEEERVARERREEKQGREHAYDVLEAEGEGGRSNVDGWDEEDFM